MLKEMTPGPQDVIIRPDLNAQKIEKNNQLKEAADIFLNKPLTIDSLEKFEQKKIDILTKDVISKKISVAPYSGTQKGLEADAAAGLHTIYVAPELSRFDLARIYPDLKCEMILPGRSLRTTNRITGWVNTEATTDPLYLNTATKEEMNAKISHLALQGRHCMDLNTYIPASENNYLLRGEYYDQNLTNTILNVYHKKLVLLAGFNRDGSLDILPVTKDYHDKNVGIRSRGVVKKAAPNNITPKKI